MDVQDYVFMFTPKHAYFTGLIFTVGQSNTKIGPLENETHMIFAIVKFVYACEMRGGAIAHPATR